ncbi:ABC transporter permease [Lachnoclostridium sp. Marseille-P6806]|uniref:ABC transporter permease n=1 Tax=Lachnoclostridium sp. Marseille-P6806 TaxID=2364793 RepID=UPI00102F51F6|nr:ABC transporter permease subunit [Lachnoclostridium sp. Marseille-P6806]
MAENRRTIARLQRESTGKRIFRDIKRNWRLYLMLLPGLFILIFFKIGPVAAMVIAFQKFSAYQGIFGSKFVGLVNFIKIFKDPYIPKVVNNTVILAVLSIGISFPVPVIFALFLNEIRNAKVRGFVQSLSFLPYFISSAVMVSILAMIMNPNTGIVNNIIRTFGGQPINFMAKASWFRFLYVLLEVWQTFGYSAIIYIAAMTSISPELYEAAEVDGAGRWSKMFRITLPCISTTVITMLIISVGNIFTVNLDRILLMYNQSTYDTADVIQTYVYRIGFESKGFPDYSYGAAANILKSVIAYILVILVNKLADRYAETRMF